MNAKAGWGAVADSSGDLLNRMVAAKQKLGRLLQAEFNQVGALLFVTSYIRYRKWVESRMR